MKKLFFIPLIFALFFSCKNSPDNTSQTPPQVKESDWLFLCYFDADGNVNDDLYTNIKDIECAFAQTRNADGSPKEGYPSVTVLLLWDGVSEENKGDQIYLHPDGALYEIGADYTLKYEPKEGNEYGAGFLKLEEGFSVGANTKDLTSQAGDWLLKEPDMSDPATLTNFLKWAKERYSSPNVVICIQDHGKGTEKETYTNSTDLSRTVCADDTSGTDRTLTCKNIKNALNDAGWTGKDKPKILWEDLCLQAASEIIWNCRGCADYYCSSPNISWMPDYYGVFTNIKSGMSALDLGKVIVSTYLHRYYGEPMQYPQSKEDAMWQRASGGSMFTYSFLSLDSEKVEELQAGVENLAKDLLGIKEKDLLLFNSVYEKYVKQDYRILENCKGLAYPGSVAWLNDLGRLCFDIVSDKKLSSAHDSAQELLDLLENGDDKLIIYAWGGILATKEKTDGWGEVLDSQLYLTGKKDYLSQKSIDTVEESEFYGLTIVGSVRDFFPEYYNIALHYDDWTGFSESWGKVIRAWWDSLEQE